MCSKTQIYEDIDDSNWLGCIDNSITKFLSCFNVDLVSLVKMKTFNVPFVSCYLQQS